MLSSLHDTWRVDIGKIVITTLWMVGITNVLNFLDGVDELAIGSVMVNAAFFGLLAFYTSQSFMMLLSLALAGKCLKFLPWNFWLKPA